MALSGTLNSSDYDGKYIQFTWSATQSVEKNESYVTWSLKGAGSSGYHTSGGFYVKINGTVVLDKPDNGTDRIDMYAGDEVASGNVTISHNADGTKSFSVEIAAGIYTWARNCSGSATFSLNTIPRTSSISWRTVSGYDNQTAGTVAHLLITRHSTAFTHLIKYQFGSASGTIVSNTQSFSSQISWTIPMSLLNQIPSAVSGTGKITCTTYNGSTVIGSSTLSLTVKAPDSVKPTVKSAAVSNQVTGDAASVIKSWGVYVEGFSCASLSCSASGSYGSSISSFSISGNYSDSGIKPTSSGVLNLVTPTLTTGYKTYKFKAKDSRGRESEQVSTATITVYAYSAPTISSFTATRSSSDESKVVVKAVWSFAPVNGHNSAKGTLQYKVSSASAWITYGTVTSGTSVTLTTTFDKEKSYQFKLTVTDALGKSASKTVSTSTTPVLLDFRGGGKGLGIGKVSESDSLEVGLNAHFLNEVYIHDASSSKTLKEYIRSVCLPSLVQSGSVDGVTAKTSSWTSANSVTLSPGFYVGTVVAQITANSNGIRALGFSPTASGSSDIGNLQMNQPAQDTNQNRLTLPVTFNVTKDTDYTVWIYQNSGSSLTVRGRYYLLKFSTE